MRYAQLVVGPAGCGKSTYCNTMLEHCQNIRRPAHVVNLDPAAEHFAYEPLADVRELIELDDVMGDDDLRFGPNGGLVFCMEYLVKNLDWLKEKLGDFEDDYIFLDCPGQVELYTHLPVMKSLVESLHSWEFRVCAVFLIDSQFLVDGPKFISGALVALSTMVQLEIPHVNVLSKLDLLDRKTRAEIDAFLEPDSSLLADDEEGDEEGGGRQGRWMAKYRRLTKAIATVLDDFSLVRFLPLNMADDESIGDVLMTVDNAIQYGEDLDVKDKLDDLIPDVEKDSGHSYPINDDVDD